MPLQSSSPDLPTASFLILRATFFTEQAAPRVFELRDKRNTQDDPFDEHIQRLLSDQLTPGTSCA
jgi:hypothetical protein